MIYFRPTKGTFRNYVENILDFLALPPHSLVDHFTQIDFYQPFLLCISTTQFLDNPHYGASSTSFIAPLGRPAQLTSDKIKTYFKKESHLAPDLLSNSYFKVGSYLE